MSKPKKLNFNGESKVIKYLTTCINWLLDNHTKANPTDEVTETLSKIEIDGEIYGVQGGGTEVEANPQETPTDTLSTIKINNTVYDLSTTAEKTSYDNTNSDLYADNVQDAIDELVQPFKFEIDPTDNGINIVYDDSILNGGE